jgi:site-specific recombinase XerD
MSTTEATPVPARTLDRRGRLRSPAAMPGFHKGRVPVTKGRSLPPDPPCVEDVVALLEQCKPLRAGRKAELSAMRLRALVIVLWRTGLRISEALALEERDLNRADLAVTVRRGKGGKRRMSAMDEWAWQEIDAWLRARPEIPFGAVFCILSGPTAGQSMSDTDARRQLRQAARRASLRRRMNPHSFRHAHAVELRREKIDLYAIQQQLGHARLDVTQEYLRSISTTDVLEPIGHRHAPMMAVPSM